MLRFLGVVSTGFLFFSTPALANPVQESDFWSAVRGEWGRYATPETVAVIHEDVTCDGVPDYVGGYWNRDNPDGSIYNVMVISGGPNGILRGEVFFPFDDGSTNALSAPEGKMLPPVLSLEEWREEDASSNFGVTVCPTAISINDGFTEAPRLFWRGEAPAGEDRLLIYRSKALEPKVEAL